MPVVIVPAPPVLPAVTATSSDGRLTATVDLAGGGVVLRGDFTADQNKPRKIRFVRGDDQIPVRSGDLAWAPGGVANAYDFEMPLGVPSSWRAVPFYGASVLSAGPASAAVTLTSPDLDCGSGDFWLKSVSHPDLSVRVRSNIPNPEFTLTGRDSLADLPGSDLPGGSWDIAVKGQASYTFLTRTKTEFDDLAAVLKGGPLLLQCLTVYGIDDGYYVLGSASWAYQVGAYDPKRLVAVTFKPVPRPPTTDSPLIVPGRSYIDTAAAVASYSQLDASQQSYDAVLAP